MDKLLDGIEHFQTKRFPEYRELFAGLADGQSPETLFITCADSRIDPSLITSSMPGDLFVCRNAGNIVPPYSGSAEGTGASIEYAVIALGISNIVVCGHSGCGAMTGVLNPDAIRQFPQVSQWLTHSHAAVSETQGQKPDADDQTQLDYLIERNVVLQLQHLRTHPAVAARVTAGSLRLHGWVYDIGSGAIATYDPATDAFKPLQDRRPA